MKVSLVATVKDAGSTIETFLRSIRAQTLAPDEVVVVDGGSTDGTLEALEASGFVTTISDLAANIAMGRNAAIRAATHDVLAVTDADCALAPDWLERILVPIEGGADVAMGFTRPAPRSFFEVCAAAIAVPDVDEVDPSGFMPSARSVAFRRSAIEAVGGYPEWLEVGEDMYVNQRWRHSGLRMEFVPDALVWWPMRPDLPSTWHQYARYARGDAEAHMYPERHAIRTATYTLGPALWLSGPPPGGGSAPPPGATRGGPWPGPGGCWPDGPWSARSRRSRSPPSWPSPTRRSCGATGPAARHARRDARGPAASGRCRPGSPDGPRVTTAGPRPRRTIARAR
ncbi:MAG: glycosyltransferase [Actinomycetota bacterium]